MNELANPTEIRDFLRLAAERIRHGYEVVSVDLDDLKIVVLAERDEETSPTDYDCYSSADIERWRRDEWSFIGVTLTLRYADGAVEGSDCLWGIDHLLTENDETEIDYLATEVLPGLWSEAERELRENAGRALRDASQVADKLERIKS